MFSPKIKVDEELLKRCKQHAKAAGYSSVEEFVHHVLDSVLKRDSLGTAAKDEDVLKRLKGLGYIE